MHTQVRRALLAAALATTVLLPAGAPSVIGASAAPPDPAVSPASRAATGPGTIVFIRAHNVWIARGDGSGQLQVTTDGDATTPYVSPSQSDTGIIVAGHGPHIVVMRQNGDVVNRMDPPPLQNSVSHPLDGPVVQSAISPDGSLIAYTFGSWECAVGVPCNSYRATGITRADTMTPAATYGQTYFWSPSWVGNARTIQTGGYLHQADFKDLGAAPVHWFDDKDLPEVDAGMSTDLDDLELSADGRWLAAVRGYAENTQITWYAVAGEARSGPPPAVPDWLCATSKLAGLASPTWSPDSAVLAWQEPDGIWSVRPDPAQCANPELLIADGGQPDWSAAPLAPPAHPVTQFTVQAKPKVGGKARVGKVLRATAGVWSPKPQKVAFRWLRNGKPIAKATKKQYRLKAADRGRRISVRVTATSPGVKARSVTSKPTGKVRR